MAFDQLSGIRRWGLHELLRLDRSDGTGDLALLLCTVTDHNHLIQILRVLIHTHSETLLVAHFDILVQITDIGNGQCGTSSGLYCEITIYVGNGSIRRAFNYHVGTNNGFAVLINYGTFYLLALLCSLCFGQDNLVVDNLVADVRAGKEFVQGLFEAQ